MSKLERLLNLTAALLATERPLLADDIRRRVEGYPDGDTSFHRAFERDKDDLRSMGIPLSLDPIPGTDPPREGYRIRRSDYAGADPELTPDELAALHVAANLIRLDGVDESSAFWKLGGVANPEAVEASPLAALPADPNLGPFFAAVSSGQSVRFTYHETVRHLDPHRLSFARGHWYISGVDRDRGEDRIFRLDRIVGAIEEAGSVLPTDATAPAGRTLLPSWELGDGEPVVATLLVDADQASLATHHLGPDRLRDERTDGSRVFEIEVRNVEAFRSFVLTFLEHAEILDPPHLRDDLVSWLEAMAVS